ncbi:phosphoprotein [Rodent hepevirus]|nr:phosphoprotein [Rodent hepevirus]
MLPLCLVCWLPDFTNSNLALPSMRSLDLRRLLRGGWSLRSTPGQSYNCRGGGNNIRVCSMCAQCLSLSCSCFCCSCRCCLRPRCTPEESGVLEGRGAGHVQMQPCLTQPSPRPSMLIGCPQPIHSPPSFPVCPPSGPHGLIGAEAAHAAVLPQYPMPGSRQ